MSYISIYPWLLCLITLMSHGISNDRPPDGLFNSLFKLQQRKRQNSLLALCEGNGFPLQGPVMRKTFPCQSVLMLQQISDFTIQMQIVYERRSLLLDILLLIIRKWTLRNKLQWNLNRNSYVFIQENENVVRKVVAILSRPQCVKTE